jgi:cobalt/nickel transport system ATP-binding protein
MSHHIVEVKDLAYTYPDGTEALKGLSFLIHHGESVALVGANGAGKSTLLLHLIGYLLARRGRVRIGDYPVTRQTVSNIRKSVGMVFQDPDDQLFMPTVFEDVAFGPLNLGFPEDEVRARVTDALERVGAGELGGRPPYALSGGEKRSVAIATVLAMSPDILVMDEPSSNLDPGARRRLIGQLDSFEHTKIIATHDLDLALEVCRRTIVMRDGQVVADGPTEDVFADDDLLAACSLERPMCMCECRVSKG